MSIFGGLLAAIGAVLFLLWRLQQAANASRDIAEAAGDIRGMARAWSWRRKANTNPIDLVDDPREAAAVLMAAIAGADGAISERERTVILSEMQTHFGATAAQAEELLARARWMTKESTDPAEVMRRLTRVVREKLAPKQRGELIAMLEKVAAADGRQDDAITSDIRRLAQTLKA